MHKKHPHGQLITNDYQQKRTEDGAPHGESAFLFRFAETVQKSRILKIFVAH